MTPEILARITAARACRDLSDLARQGVGATAEPASSAERLTAARRLRVLANEIVDRMVVAEALAGTSWDELAAALGRDPHTLATEYGESVAQWGGLTETEMEGEADSAEALDAWYARHQEDGDPPARTPVANLLNRR
ncbi:hypothetical protein [Streptomyces sp. NPDC046685]|uniref:hypothetical protein n=1 Tax=Streptomyces sp. NPDC046685 TaxID=3157202 RepID=UPI0033CFED10